MNTTKIETQNTEQVTKIFDAFARGDVGYILDQLADDVRFVSHLDPIVPWAGEYSGRDNVTRFFQALGSSVEVADHPVNALVAQGDTVVAMGDGEPLEKGERRRFRRSVWRREHVIQQCCRRDRADEVSLMAREHSWEHMPCDQYVRHHVDVPDVLPVFVRSLGTSAYGDAGVGADDVDPSICGLGLCDHRAHRRLIGDIACDRNAFELASNRLGAWTVDVGHDDACRTCAREP